MYVCIYIYIYLYIYVYTGTLARVYVDEDILLYIYRKKDIYEKERGM